jgi:hypothetical protein
VLDNVQAAFSSRQTTFRVKYSMCPLSARRSLAATSQLRYLNEGKDILTTFYSPHQSSFADLLFRHATQRTQSVFIGMVRKETAVIGDQAANDISTRGSAVSGVLDRVSLS